MAEAQSYMIVVQGYKGRHEFHYHEARYKTVCGIGLDSVKWRLKLGTLSCKACIATLKETPGLIPLTCLKCGRQWTPKVEAPEKCPTCRSHHYDTPLGYRKPRVIGNSRRTRAVLLSEHFLLEV